MVFSLVFGLRVFIEPCIGGIDWSHGVVLFEMEKWAT